MTQFVITRLGIETLFKGTNVNQFDGQNLVLAIDLDSAIIKFSMEKVISCRSVILTKVFSGKPWSIPIQKENVLLNSLGYWVNHIQAYNTLVIVVFTRDIIVILLNLEIIFIWVHIVSSHQSSLSFLTRFYRLTLLPHSASLSPNKPTISWRFFFCYLWEQSDYYQIRRSRDPKS